jgi:ribosomal protein S18 acetylase RimI-like enzyme
LSQVQIRQVRPAEYAEAGRLVVAAYRALAAGHMTDEYAAELAAVGRRAAAAEVLVAVDGSVVGSVDGAVDGAVVGSVTLVADLSSPWAEMLEPGEAGIRMLAVDPAAQGSGVGRALLEACIERGRELGKAALFLHTTPWMPVAARMYERAGFTRQPGRDWLPVPEVPLIAYRLPLPRPQGGKRQTGGTR